MVSTPGSGRAHEIPPALNGEILRLGVLSRLERRWEVPVTTVVAGAGFGKSTVIAQARRLQSLAPDGYEIYHRCDDGDEDASRLALAITHLFEPGGSPAHARQSSSRPADRVLDVLRARVPIPVCVILDDVHELPAGSSGAQLIADVVDELPDHAHVVLVGRRLPAVRLGHLHAADRIVHIDAGELSFSPEELREVAEQSGRPYDSVEGLGGWPALVRLTLTAPAGVSRQYVWDEVVSSLDPDLREAVPYLALAGELDRDDIRRLLDRDLDPERLATDIPLVELSGRETVRCHQLWRDVAGRLWPRDVVDHVRRQVVDALLARREIVRAGSVAVDGRDRAMSSRPATALVGATIGAFPADTGERWLRGLGVEGNVAEAGVELLRIATLQARAPHDPHIADALNRLLTRDDLVPDVRIAALAIGGIAAHAMTDVAWLEQLVRHARAFAESDDDPIARLVHAGISAAAAELDGDVARGLADVERLGLGQALGDTVARFYVHLLILAGRADDAIPVADAIAAGEYRIGASRFPAFARWCDADPSAILERPGDLTVEPGTNDRFRFAHFVHHAAICASLGLRPELAHAVSEIRLSNYRSTKDQAQRLVAEAASDIMHGDEASAAERYRAHLERFPPGEMVSSVHLRRYPAIGYPLSPGFGELWDEASLGPTLRRQLEVGRLLVRARRGEIDTDSELPATDLLLTSLPLPWSTELLARCHVLGHPDSSSRLVRLVELTEGRAHDELRGLLDAGRVPEECRDLSVRVRRPSTTVLRIELIDGFRLLRDGVPIEAAELRRQRVKQVLGLLVVEGSMTRDRLMECVWPELQPSVAARNLRVTLSYVRRVLDGAGSAGLSRLHDDGQSLSLTNTRGFETDLWDLRRLSGELADARTRGDALSIEDALERIAAVDARDPLPDLIDIVEVRSCAEWCRAEILDAVLSLGERRMAQGRPADALAFAQSARSVSAWSERAGRLAIAAHLLCGDGERATVEARRMERMLDDLGVEPDDHTRLLLTRVPTG